MISKLVGRDDITNTDDFVFKLLKEANPDVGYELSSNTLTISNFRVNNPLDPLYPHDALVEFTALPKSGLEGSFIFNYKRLNLAKYAFEETKTIGFIDIPLILKNNTEQGVRNAFWGLLKDVQLVNTTNDSTEWKCILGLDNKALCFAYDENGSTVYEEYFTLYTSDRHIPRNEFIMSRFALLGAAD